jgi:hypothetical protein
VPAIRLDSQNLRIRWDRVNPQLSINTTQDQIQSVSTSGEKECWVEEISGTSGALEPRIVPLGTSTKFWLPVTCITWFRKKG